MKDIKTHNASVPKKGPTNQEKRNCASNVLHLSKIWLLRQTQNSPSRPLPNFMFRSGNFKIRATKLKGVKIQKHLEDRVGTLRSSNALGIPENPIQEYRFFAFLVKIWRKRTPTHTQKIKSFLKKKHKSDQTQSKKPNFGRKRVRSDPNTLQYVDNVVDPPPLNP